MPAGSRKCLVRLRMTRLLATSMSARAFEAAASVRYDLPTLSLQHALSGRTRVYQSEDFPNSTVMGVPTCRSRWSTVLVRSPWKWTIAPARSGLAE
ncbi:putative glutathione-dependent formaldehyde dehydrogenase [Thermomicrobium roseum DSM 5159]|uniref:Putative glutathione-dependent formaldehyde dehydrogenase n=1 Tax=Thermomicrobium roseum (strain ATCC 27502 / DSM 5159 / P-2) TaxID=309801 RepID=B9KZU1_THERP|nr:putative glutathione-dependent formaldehyde dehydrogenase [Thermomicrobium roseum DSM 5159]